MGKPNAGKMKVEYKSSVTRLEDHTFKYGSPKYVEKIVRTQKQIANYIQKKYDKGRANITSAIRNLTMPTVPMPTQPDPTTATLVKMEIWKKQYR